MVAVQDSSLRSWSKQTGNDCFAGSESVPGTEDEGQALPMNSPLTRSIKVRNEFSHVGAVDQAQESVLAAPKSKVVLGMTTGGSRAEVNVAYSE